MEERDWNSKEYKQWRLAIYKRDNFCCKMPGCKKRGMKCIQAHHIRRWANFPELRFELSNGITLCKYHHRLVSGNEESYEQVFNNLLTDFNLRIKRIKYGK